MTYTSVIFWAAQTVKVPAALLLAICVHETGLNNTVNPYDGNSPTFGICQIKFSTAQSVGFTGLAKDLMVPKINAYWAAQYLKSQMDRYDGDWCKVVAAYNAGSYNESKIMPGYPRNLKYVRGVQRKLASIFKPMLSCNRRKS